MMKTMIVKTCIADDKYLDDDRTVAFCRAFVILLSPCDFVEPLWFCCALVHYCTTAASNGGLPPLIMMMGPLCKTHPVAQTPRVHPCVQPLRFHHRAKPCVKEFWWKRRHPPLDKGSLDTSRSANRFLLWSRCLSVKSGWNGLMLIFFKLWWPWSLYCDIVIVLW